MIRARDSIEAWTEAGRELGARRYVLLTLLHLPLGLLMAASITAATLHALVIASVAGVAVLGRAKASTVAMAAAYIAGSDVLWRMTEADVYHQFGKYGVVVLLGLWMLRNGRLRLTAGPVLYFALLVPSVMLVVAAGGRSGSIQRPISFNLSGPLALAVAMLFFHQVHLRRADLLRVLAALALPAFSVLAIAAESTLTAGKISFGGSNFVTSGGYGPNQVSAVLGLGCLALLLILAISRTGILGRLVMTTGAVLLALQAALTFSRGGLYSTGGALLATTPFFVSSQRARMRLVVLGLVFVVVALTLALPWLDDFTAGQFSKRMEDTRLAGRDQLMERDLALWTKNAFLGVGPGMSKLTPTDDKRATLAHTEFTRLIAEHGALGALAALTLLVMALRFIVKSRPGVPRGLTAAFATWTFLYMIHAAMRLAAPSFIFALCAAIVTLDYEDEPLPTSEEPIAAPPKQLSARTPAAVAS